MIHPSTHVSIFDFKKEETLNTISNKMRHCQFEGCGKEYKPAGNRQKFCTKHSPKIQGHKKLPKKSKSVIIKKSPSPEIIALCSEEGKIINVLIAAGLITREKIEQILAIVGG
jgi:hypothetical protein